MFTCSPVSPLLSPLLIHAFFFFLSCYSSAFQDALRIAASMNFSLLEIKGSIRIEKCNSLFESLTGYESDFALNMKLFDVIETGCHKNVFAAILFACKGSKVCFKTPLRIFSSRQRVSVSCFIPNVLFPPFEAPYSGVFWVQQTRHPSLYILFMGFWNKFEPSFILFSRLCTIPPPLPAEM